MPNIFNEIFSQPLDAGSLPPPQINTEEFLKVVESRRSVRKYTDRKIPANIMGQIIRSGLLAPSSSNLQPWEFYLIKSEETRKKIDIAFLSQPAVTTAAEVLVVVARTATWKRNSLELVKVIRETNPNPPKSLINYYTKAIPFVFLVGPFNVFGFIKKIILGVVGLFRPVPRESTSHCDLKIWAVKSASLACQNIMLAARAYGFDSCPMEGMDSTRVKKILNLPQDAIVVMGISFGERASSGVYGAQVRLPSSLFVKTV